MDRYWLRIVRAPIELEGNYARGLRKYYIYREIRLKSTIVDGLTVPVNAIPCDTIMENIIVSFHIYIRV